MRVLPPYVIDSLLMLLLPAPRWAGNNTDLPSNRIISKTVRVNIVFTERFSKNIQEAF